MQGKIDEEIPINPSANFLPMYPENGWPIFQGLFSTFYEALDDLCEFQAPNVLQCGVGARVRDILRTLKRYLSKMGLITWSPDQLQSWFQRQEKFQELRKSKKIRGKQNKKIETEVQYTNKKKRQSEAFCDAPGVKSKLKTYKQPQSSSKDYKVSQPKQWSNKREKKDKERVALKAPTSSSSSLPFVCGQCLKQYKNVRSYRTHMYQVHKKEVPKDSSHDIHGKAFVRAVPLMPKPSTKFDQLQQPRQDVSRKLSSGPSQKDSEMIEETPQGQIVHGRKAQQGSFNQHAPASIPPKGKKK